MVEILEEESSVSFPITCLDEFQEEFETELQLSLELSQLIDSHAKKQDFEQCDQNRLNLKPLCIDELPAFKNLLHILDKSESQNNWNQFLALFEREDTFSIDKSSLEYNSLTKLITVMNRLNLKDKISDDKWLELKNQVG